MNKTTKGALGAAAAAVLLLGGAGSLAYWSDDATVNGGAINSGNLTLDAVGCDPDWVYSTGGATVIKFVPGDVVEKSCTFTIGAQGDNLEASPTVPDSLDITVTPVTVPPAVLTATVDATYELPGGPLTAADTITEANDGETLTATLVVTIPFGTADGATGINDNEVQNITATLDELTVTLTQVA